MIDSSDRVRIEEAKQELHRIINDREMKDSLLLVFANKQDIAGALPAEAISDELGLAGGEMERPWSVRGCCALKGEGLEEGLDW